MYAVCIFKLRVLRSRRPKRGRCAKLLLSTMTSLQSMLGRLQRLSRAHFMRPGDSRLRASSYGCDDRNRIAWSHLALSKPSSAMTLPPKPLEAGVPGFARAAPARLLYPVRVHPRDDRLRSLWTICSAERRFTRALAADTLLPLYEHVWARFRPQRASFHSCGPAG